MPMADELDLNPQDLAPGGRLDEAPGAEGDALGLPGGAADVAHVAEDVRGLLCDLVDLVMPGLTPYESALYLLLLRMSFLRDNSDTVRIGKKRVLERLGRSSRAAAGISFAQVTEVFRSLELKGCIVVGDTTREGTLYQVLAPREVPFVVEKLASSFSTDDEHFTNPEKRLSLFARDDWTCQYCGERVTHENATLDHYVPQSRGGSHVKENLRTCCGACAAIKSGKSFEEAAPLILKNMHERRQRRVE